LFSFILWVRQSDFTDSGLANTSYFCTNGIVLKLRFNRRRLKAELSESIIKFIGLGFGDNSV